MVARFNDAFDFRRPAALPIALAPGELHRDGMRIRVRVVGGAVGAEPISRSTPGYVPEMNRAAIVWLAMLGCGGGASDAPATGSGAAAVRDDGPTIDVTAIKLFADYKGNELAADKQYKGRRARVVGQLERAYRDSDGHTIVLLQAEDKFSEVSCLYDGNEDAIAAVRPGAQVALAGVGAGMARIGIMRGPGLTHCDVSPPRGDADKPKPDTHCNQGDAEHNRKCRERYYDKMRSADFEILETDSDAVTVELLFTKDPSLCGQAFKDPKLALFEGRRFKVVGVQRIKCVDGMTVDLTKIDGSASGE